MPVLTIFNHGTANTSQLSDPAKVLVIAELGRLMPQGQRRKKDWSQAGNENWILNEGAGTYALRDDLGAWECQTWKVLAGIIAGTGVDENAERSVQFVRAQIGNAAAANYTVNLAGHSRGSITCFKIAHKLHHDPATNGCSVNIFAIDPVPGNCGRINSSSYEGITIQANVQNSFMMLAESERRTAFRPYIDDVFLGNKPQHRLDTIPGNHGKINELGSKEKPWSAEIVLHHAIKFLTQHGTVFDASANVRRLDDTALLDRYAKVMMNFHKYNKPSKGIRHVGIRTKDKDRVANVRFAYGVQGPERDAHHGEQLATLGPAELGQTQVPNRFFANGDHKNIFFDHYPALCICLLGCETKRALTDLDLRKMNTSVTVMVQYYMMSTVQQEYVDAWCMKKFGQQLGQ